MRKFPIHHVDPLVFCGLSDWYFGVVCGFVILGLFLFWCSKIEGSKATAKQTAELLRSVISQQRMPHVNQAGALIDAIKVVGEQLIAANPVGMLPISFLCCHFL